MESGHNDRFFWCFSLHNDKSHLSLQKESMGVLSVFKQTMEKLASINEKAMNERKQKLQQIETLKVEESQLESLCQDNTSIIKNIDNLLNFRG